MLTLETKISIPKDVLFHEVDDEEVDEMVLLNLVNGKYFQTLKLLHFKQCQTPCGTLLS